MNRVALSGPLFSSKRPPMKKEATAGNTKGLIKKTSNEKRGNPKIRKGTHVKYLR
jgi:hypothetical protein